MQGEQQVPAVPRRRRRAVGPPGARPAADAGLEVLELLEPEPAADPAGDERLRREVPPHHGG